MKWFKMLFAVTVCALALGATAQTGKTIYQYKKYEKFDFNALSLEGDYGNPGDLSIVPRYRQQYKNRLPYRKNFNSEIRQAVSKTR